MHTPETMPVVATARLRLRKPQKADVARIATLANDFDVARMTTRMPFPYGLEDAESFIARMEAKDPTNERAFLIEHPVAGPIGMLGFHPNEAGRPELGYWLGRSYWGRGFATEAARGALDWVKRAWRKRFVSAGHFSDNPASGQVLCKAGFLYTGDIELRESAARHSQAPTRMMVWLA